MAEEVHSTINTRPQHFVLVHGVGHGAWCWFKVRHLLESSGHKVTCLDLASTGVDCSNPNSILTIEEYDKPLSDFMSALPADEKVVLVGHSAGGISLTHIMYEFGEKIAMAIFVAATMLRSGFQSEDDIRDGIPNLSKFGDVYEFNFGLGNDNPPTSVALRKEFQRIILYQLSPIEDSTLASMLLCPWPCIALQNARFDGGEKNVDQVKRVFIRTTYDNMVKPEQQDSMIKRWPPSDVFYMETDHSPFFSNPVQLFELIIKATTQIISNK